MILGLQELKGKLRSMRRRADVVGGRAAVEAAEVIESAAKGRSPVLSGRLRSSIRTNATPDGAEVLAGDEGQIDYADDVEYREPFMRPAIDATTEQRRTVISNVVEKELKRYEE